MNTDQSTASAIPHLHENNEYRRKLLNLLLGGALICGAFALHTAKANPQYEEERISLNMPAGAETTAPLGYRMMCEETPLLCVPNIGMQKRAPLSDARMEQLRKINVDANTSIKAMTDKDLYGTVEKWTLPTWAGDCEDYVLLKRKKLIEKGWPEETLLITVVRDLKGEGHAVLTVVTDKGDLILDNHTNSIKLWYETGYGFIKRQSQRIVTHWVSLKPADALPVQDVATSRSAQ